MKFLKVFFACIVLISCNTNSNSQSNQSPELIIEEFFELYDSKGPQNALEFILSTNKWVSDGSTELKNSFQDLVTQLGYYFGHELIAKRSIGENYILWSYMIKYERQPIRFK